MAKKIIWPISPLESTPTGDEKLKQIIDVLSEKMDVTICPVYVLSSEYFLTSEYFEPIDMAGLAANLKNECVNYLNQFQNTSIEEPVVLENSWSTKSAEINIFLEYVQKEQPDFVLMTSHGRSGWERAFLGSFTENFLLQSQCPVIVIGPQCEDIKSFESAIMPVQLDEAAQSFIGKFLDDHRLAFVERLALFHKITMLDFEEIAWAPTLYGLGEFSGADLVNKAKQTTENFLNAFKEHPLSQKRLETRISEKLETVPNEIEAHLKDGAFDMVVMKTEAGTIEANVLGSVTRSVIRQSSRPVIVYPHLFGKGNN